MEDDSFLINLFLWENNLEYYRIYDILRNYLTESSSIDTAVLLSLINARGLPVEETLATIPYIHSGFLSIILKKVKK